MDRDAACSASGLDPAKRYLLFMGRLKDHVKRVSALIRAFAAVAVDYPDARLLIAGEGPDADNLKQLAVEQAPERIQFLGWVSRISAKAQLYNTAECLLLPSRREGFPAVVGEAMSCGTPVLASNVGGVSELVAEGETGWLIPPGDDAALKRALALLLADPETTASMRSAARATAKARVSPSAIADALRECFSIACVPQG
jgi:glycosyltransferase involved in cell wall biosynthesis